MVSGWRLLENGWDVDIYEKQSMVGGMCRTWRWHDFLVDTGPHIYHTPDAELARFWEQEFGDLFVHGEFWCKNVKGDSFDEYWDYPLSWESISRFPQELKARVLRELDDRDPHAKATALNYSEYMDAEVGPTLRKMFYEKYPEKIWGIPVAEMTAEWAPKRVKFRRKVTPFYHNEWNAVGKYGTGCIYERIRDKILSLGGRLHLNATVTGIRNEGAKLAAIEFAGREAHKLERSDYVISSLPITLTARLLGHDSTLAFRGICSVYLAYNRASVLPDGLHWLYYDSERLLFNRVTESKRLSPYVAPDDKTFLTAEITYSRGDAVDAMDREALMRKLADEVAMTGLVKTEDLIDTAVNFEPFVYPIQYSGYQEELARTRSVVSRYDQLYSIGTGGDFDYTDSQVLFHKAFDTVDILCGSDSVHAQVIRRNASCKLNPVFQISDRKIGGGSRAYVIAEAGLNHNGDVEMARQLIDRASDAGCDAVKFQTFTAAGRISRKVKSVRYAETITGLQETVYEMFDRLAMSFQDQEALFEHARQRGIEMFSTPFDEDSVEFLETMGVNLYKIASMDLVNLPLIERVARTGKPTIVSTGMSTLGQVEEAVEVFRQSGNPNLALLHCNSSYPAAPEEMNLRVITTLKAAFHIPVGLSDHTFGLFAAQTAVTLGADLIERHFTLDRTLEGPDHIMSSDPGEMSELVRAVRDIPIMLGDGHKQIQPSEYETINTQRKSLYAACDIEEGQIVTCDTIIIKGPGGGILPRDMDIVVGRIARCRIEADCPILWHCI